MVLVYKVFLDNKFIGCVCLNWSDGESCFLPDPRVHFNLDMELVAEDGNKKVYRLQEIHYL